MSTPSKFRLTLAAACLLATSANAVAAPYWTGYRGTIADSTIPAIVNGEHYTVNLIFDNGGNTANNQTWDEDDLKCMVWFMNDANNVMFVQDLTKPSANFLAQGQITTNNTGVTNTLFSTFGTTGTAGAGFGSYVGQGLAGLLTEPYAAVPHTYLDGVVFIAGGPGTYENRFSDFNGAIPVTPNQWAPVQPFTGWGIQDNPRFSEMTGCFVPETPPAPAAVTSVPALGIPALALLGLAAAAVGGRRLRRNKA